MSEHVFPEELEMIPSKLSEDVKNAKQKKKLEKRELRIKYCATFVIYFCAFVYVSIFQIQIAIIKMKFKTLIKIVCNVYTMSGHHNIYLRLVYLRPKGDNEDHN